ncbi:hypothetical protein ABK040_009569 [Willaertia magna]
MSDQVAQTTEKEWDKNTDLKELIEHKYVASNTRDTFIFIEDKLKKLGYNEDNNKMVHDYLQNMIADTLLKNGETFITENDIRQMNTISALLNNTTPDFIIKSVDKRKTLIIDVYTGEKDVIGLKSKYGKLEFFADFKIITQHNFQTELKIIFSDSDIDYIFKNYQVFLTEYHYWKACMKFKKILFNDKENLKLVKYELKEEINELNKQMFKQNLESYASNVLSKNGI